MKRRSLVIVAALGLGLGLSSCGNSEEPNKQQLFSNASLGDGDGFGFYKNVHELGTNAIEVAKYANSQGASGEVKALNDKILEVYPSLLAEMETLGSQLQVVLPDPGAQVFNADEAAADSTYTFALDTYLAKAAEDTGRIAEEFKRASRNTEKSTRAFAAQNLEAVKEIYILAGGKKDEGGHH